MESRQARVARGLIAALLSTFVAAVSHGSGGGAFPHPMLLLAGLVFSWLFCIGVAGRRVTVVRLVPAVAACQLLFHLLFSMTGSPDLPSGHLHHLPAMAATSHDGPVSVDTGMLVAHVLAGLVTILALRFGEAAFWGLFDTARLMLTTLFRFSVLDVVPVGFQPAPVSARVLAPVLVPPFLASDRHRGPPAVIVQH